MRFVVLLFGFSGFLLTAAAGCFFAFYDYVHDDLRGLQITIPEEVFWSPVLPLEKLPDAGLFLLIAAGYGLLGTLMAFFRRGKQGAMLMLIPIFGAAFMNPLSLAFTGLMFLTALASFFVGPLPLNPPKDDDDED
jgi:hypothetical protein